MSAAVVSISRIPRTAALILAGVGMSVSGVIMQQMTECLYHLLQPVLSKLQKWDFSSFLIFTPQPVCRLNVICYISKNMIFLAIVRKIKHRNIIFVPLVGLMFGGIVGSISTFFAVQI